MSSWRRTTRGARRWLSLWSILVIGLATAVVSLAFYTTTGSGSGTAGAGTLPAPLITATTPGAGTIALTWTAVAPPAGSTPVTYHVTRNGGAAAGSCPAAAAPTGVLTCTDSGLIAGTYTYTVTATWTSWTATSGAATVPLASGAATQLVFTTQPVGGVSEGVAFGSSPVVVVRDAAGNVASADTGSVTLAIESGPATGILSCSNGGFPTVAAVAGIAAFTGCQVTGTAAAGTYTLKATRTGLTQAVSGNVSIQVGAANKLAFTTQPGDSTGGIALASQPRVAVQDRFGNAVTTDASSVSLTIGTNPSGGTLTCAANPVTVVGGSATFTGCAIDRVGAGYTLVATDGSLTSATSTALNIAVGPAARLAFTVQPSGAVAARAFSTQPVVTVQDAGGNTVTVSANLVTLTIGTNPTGGALTCTTNPLATTAGVTTFAGCRISNAGVGYTLTANVGTLTAATSSPFDVAKPPIVRVATGPTVTRTGSGSFSPPLPAGLLGNDLMMLIVANTKVNASAAPAGWTTIATDGTPTGADMSLSVFYRFFQTGVTSPGVTVNTDGGGASARIVAYRNVSTTNPLDVTASAGVSGNAASTFTPPGLATLTANAYAVSIVAQNDRDRTPPTLSMIISQGFAMESGFPDAPAVGNNGNHHALCVAGRLVPTPSAVLFPTFGTNTFPRNSVWVGVSIALRP